MSRGRAGGGWGTVNELCYFSRLIYEVFCYSSKGSLVLGPLLYYVGFTWVPFYSRAFGLVLNGRFLWSQGDYSLGGDRKQS